MARFNRIKEEIGWLKVVFGVLVAVDASLVAWLAQNYEQTEGALLVAGPIATISVTVAIIWVNRQAHKRLEELEEL